VLERGDNEIHVPDGIRERALVPIRRMLEFSRQQDLVTMPVEGD
jgi:quinolinate synthase